jgi:hypothetical protein
VLPNITQEIYIMATSTPFVNVSVNRFGFNVLDIRINLVGTENPRQLAVMMVLMACGITDPEDQQDQMEWLESNYKQSVDGHADVKPGHTTFYLNDDLVSFRYELEKDKH